MKNKRAGWILVLAAAWCVAGFSCKGNNSDQEGGWLSAELARQVDRQYGEIITHDPSSPQQGDGSHEGDLLLGEVSLATITQAAQYLTEQLLIPVDPSGNLGKVLQPAPLLSKLATIAAAAVDQDPCRRDSDNDGIPDLNEDLNEDPAGLCTIPAAVECTIHGDHSFTVKFSHCVPVTTAFSATWSPQVTTTLLTPWATWTHTSFSGSTLVGRTYWNRLTNTTTNGTITNPTLATWQTWGIGNVGCQGGTILNYQTVFTPELWRITATTNHYRKVDLIYDGAITLHLGTVGVDEQVLHVNYNRFTRIWGDAHTGTKQNSRYLILDGPSMEYRVLNTVGGRADGTTPFPIALNTYIHEPDGMNLEKYRVIFDPDGEDGRLPAGNYRVNRGVDNEDGRFFLEGNNRVVALKDKNGPDPADLLSSPALGIEVDGVRVLEATTTTITFALNFYDANALLGNGLPGDNLGAMCGRPFSDTRCRVVVEVNYWQRTFSVREADPSICLGLWDWTPTNPKYQKVPY